MARLCVGDTDMAIKMRVNKDGDEIRCQCCNQNRKNSLEMFDLMVGQTYLRLCDVCVEQLFSKTLKATCMVNRKLKSPADMRVIRKRGMAKRDVF